MGIYYSVRILQLLLHPFNGFFSRTTWVGLYQKGNTILDLNETRDDAVWGWQWHQLDHMQAICTSLQTDDHTNASSLIICLQCFKTLLVRRQEEHRACKRLSDEYTAEIQSVFADIVKVDMRYRSITNTTYTVSVELVAYYVATVSTLNTA